MAMSGLHPCLVASQNFVDIGRVINFDVVAGLENVDSIKSC